jgi:hypothetical protein
VFTARYALSSYIKQIRFIFKGLIKCVVSLAKRVIHTVKSSVPSFKFQYLLFSLTSKSSCLRVLPRVLVLSAFLAIFSSLTGTFFRRKFLCKM